MARRIAAALLLIAAGCAAPGGRTVTAQRPAAQVLDETVGDGCRAYHRALDHSGPYVGRVVFPVLYVVTFPLQVFGGSANLSGLHWP